jgi:type I restriction enzyme S subunit
MTLIPWLGESRYPTTSVKHAFHLTLGKMLQTSPAGPSDTEVPYFKSLSVQWSGVVANPDVRMWATPAERRELAVRRGDLLICEGGDVGRAAIYDGPEGYIFQNSVHRARPVGGNENRYLKYVMQALHGSGWLDVLCNKATIRHLTGDKLGALEMPLPDPDEQRRIADFLDAETARIDSLAALRERQVRLALTRLESLAERETGRVLVRGADEPSGGWAVHPLRRAVSAVKTGATPPGSGPELWAEDTRPDALPWYGPSSFQGLTHLGTPVRHLPREAVRDRVVPLFAKGSVLIIGIGATAGKVAYLDHDACANQQITALSPERGVLGKFLAWQLWAATRELRELAPYTTLPIINNDFLKSFPVAMPAEDVQSAVARRLDRAAERVGELHAAAARAAKLVQERRHALITAAVTGRFDIATAGGRHVTEGVPA